MVNQPIGVKVMEVDRHRNRLILSERAALREVRQARKEALIAELKVGEIRNGVVVSLENFGALSISAVARAWCISRSWLGGISPTRARR